MDGILAVGKDDVTILESTLPGQIIGTLHYMSPEQLQGKPVDVRSDIFSLGLVMYEMVTGKRAIEGDNPASIISEIMLGSIARLDPSSLHLPQAFSGIVQRCVERKPEDRWQSARDIQWILEEIKSTPEPAATTAVVPEKALWRLPKAAAVAFPLLALLVAAGAWWWLTDRAPEIPEWKVRPLTAYAGLESMPALSPDGKQVAFVWNGDGGDNLDIYVKPIGDETLPLRITSDPAADSSPAWSPDGYRLAFQRRTSETLSVVIASSHGGGERVIVALPVGRAQDPYSTLAWSPDGRYLAVAAGPILRVSVDTREVKELTLGLPASQYDAMPSYAPDGSALAFARGAYAAVRRLFVQRLDKEGNPSEEPAPISAVSQGLMGIAWWPERRSLITSMGSPEGFTEAVQVPLSGETAHWFHWMVRPCPTRVTILFIAGSHISADGWTSTSFGGRFERRRRYPRR